MTSEEHLQIHVCRGTRRRYVAQVRQMGCRRWHTVGEYRSRSEAFVVAAEKLNSTGWKRGRVLLTADYYDPVVVMEAVKP